MAEFIEMNQISSLADPEVAESGIQGVQADPQILGQPTCIDLSPTLSPTSDDIDTSQSPDVVVESKDVTIDINQLRSLVGSLEEPSLIPEAGMCHVIRKSLRLCCVDQSGNDKDKLTEAWGKLWDLVVEDNDDYEKVRKLVVNGGGVTLFLKTLEKFPENTELINKMLGCISTVMLDANLRTKIMSDDFVQKIIALADTPDVTSVSGGAINSLCIMLNDGENSWRKTKLSFTDTLVKVDSIYDRWDISNIKTSDFLNPSSWTPNYEDWFVYLESDLPQLQTHGLWNIAMCTRQNNNPQYLDQCELFEKQGGFEKLDSFFSVNSPQRHRDLVINIQRNFSKLSNGEHLDMVSKTIDSRFGKKERNILMLGLDAVGKTAILYKWKLGQTVSTQPTIGFNVETVKYKNFQFTIWDIRDNDLRYTKHYATGGPHQTHLIYVVDSVDRERIEQSRDMLMAILAYEELKNAVLLVFVNKQDLPNPMNATEVVRKLGLHSLRNRNWNIQETCAVSGDGLFEGLEWLSKQLKNA